MEQVVDTILYSRNYGEDWYEEGLIDRLRRWMEIETINKYVNFPAVSCIEIILLAENSRATLPQQNAGNAFICLCEVHQSTQTIPRSLTRTSLVTVSELGNKFYSEAYIA